MSRSLQEVAGIAAGNLEEIRALFNPGSKITLIVRNPTVEDKLGVPAGNVDFILTDDTVIDGMKALQRRGIAAGDEPTFILRGQDKTAPDCVQTWLDKNGMRIGPDKPKVTEAVRIRDAMEAWPHRKEPD